MICEGNCQVKPMSREHKDRDKVVELLKFI